MVVTYHFEKTSTTTLDDGTEDTVIEWFIYFIEGAAGGPAIQVYEDGEFVTGANGKESKVFPYAMPAVGDMIDVRVLEWGDFNGQEQVRQSDSLVLHQSGVPVDAYYLNLGEEDLVLSDENEGKVVTGTGIIVTAGASEQPDGSAVVTKTFQIAYGTQTGVTAYMHSEEGVGSFCVGASLDLAAGVVQEYQDLHEISFYHAADEIIVVDDGCEEPIVYDAANWGFEDWTDANPPAGFLKMTGDFSATANTANAWDGSSSCALNWTSSTNQDFAAGYMAPVIGGASTTFSLWVWDTDTAGRLRLAMEFYDANGDAVGSKVYSANNAYSDNVTGNAEGWGEMVLDAEAPAEAASVKTWVRMYDTPTEGEEWTDATVSIDGWSVAQ